MTKPHRLGRWLVLLGIGLCLASSDGLGQSQAVPAAPLIRVAIAQAIPEAQLTVRGRYRIVTLHTAETLQQGPSLKKAAVLPLVSGLRLGGVSLPVFGVRVEPERDASILVNGRRFRGAVEIIRRQDLTLLIVNHVELDQYLYGVLYHEVSPKWPLQVLKAQAIAARTYAIYQHLHNAGREFDVTADTASQVYGGRTSEKRKTNRAVNETRGLVLTYRGELFPAYYHATCAGRTEAAKELWQTDLPPLAGGVQCPYCTASPHYTWRANLDSDKLGRLLAAAGSHVGDVVAIEPVAYTPSGRLKQVRVRGSVSAVTLTGKRLRELIGANVLRSLTFTAELRHGTMRFAGRGWGHGVGLCQWGAFGLARQGATAAQILAYYYPGAAVTPLTTPITTPAHPRSD